MTPDYPYTWLPPDDAEEHARSSSDAARRRSPTEPAGGQPPLRTASSVVFGSGAASTVDRNRMFGVSHVGRVKPDSGPSDSSTSMHAGLNEPIS